MTKSLNQMPEQNRSGVITHITFGARAWVCVIAFLAVFAATPGEAIAQQSETLTRAQWPQKRDGTSMTRVEPLQRVVAQIQNAPASRLLVQFPEGNRGNAWAVELRDWLVSLGLDSGRIQLESAISSADALTLTVLNN